VVNHFGLEGEVRRRGPPLCPAGYHTRRAIVCWEGLSWHGGGRGDGPTAQRFSVRPTNAFFTHHVHLRCLAGGGVMIWPRGIALRSQVDIEIGSLSKAFSVSGHARGPPMLDRPIAPVPCCAVLSALARGCRAYGHGGG
jgi:hypothetical protein